MVRVVRVVFFLEVFELAVNQELDQQRRIRDALLKYLAVMRSSTLVWGSIKKDQRADGAPRVASFNLKSAFKNSTSSPL